MTNAWYTVYKNRVLGSGSSSLADWDTDTIKAVLCTDTYAPDIDTDDFLADIPSGARAATATLSSLAISAGAVTIPSTVTFSSVPAGDDITMLAIYKDTGSAATSPLLILFDTFASGMPVTPDGTNIVVTFNASGIFTL